MKRKKQKQPVLERDREGYIEMIDFGTGYGNDDLRLETRFGYGVRFIFWAEAEGWIRMDCTAGAVEFSVQFPPAELRKLAKIVSHLAEVADKAICLKRAQRS